MGRLSGEGDDATITVLILSWNRPLYLWACLDSLYRLTRYPARFILVDNHSDDPMVRTVVEGFERRGMFHAVDWELENAPDRVERMIGKYRPLLGERFVFIEGDVAVFDTDPCWLARMAAHLDRDPALGMLGSYIDGRDFTDPDHARRVAPFLDDAQRDGLIKAQSPERRLPPTPPDEPIIDPFNPPGRLMMLRTRIFDFIQFGPDHELYKRTKAAGFRAGIATDVRHRHLSLLNFFDYPDYDMRRRDGFFSKPPAALPPGFDGAAYLLANPDVAAAGVDPAEHYLNHGWREGRVLRPA